jgi:hypothetical protein
MLDFDNTPLEEVKHWAFGAMKQVPSSRSHNLGVKRKSFSHHLQPHGILEGEPLEAGNLGFEHLG